MQKSAIDGGPQVRPHEAPSLRIRWLRVNAAVVLDQHFNRNRKTSSGPSAG